MDAKSLLHDTLSAVPGLSHQVIADAVGVSPNTVARWSRGEMEARDDEHLRRLAWFRAQRNAWYLLTMPAALLLWQPARPSTADEQPDDYDSDLGPISTISSRPVPRGNRVVEHEMILAATFQSMTFIAMGPDRARIRLSDRPTGRWDTTARFDRRIKSGPSRSRPSLSSGSRLSLFVKYEL